jgi:FkbM family methyltransferase
MKFEDGWWWTDHEEHMIEWIAAPKNRVMLNGRAAYQGKKQVAALTLCKSFRTAVDVGGHIGLWAFNLAHRFGVVHAFEPVADHRDCFSRNVALPNVHLHAFALGETPGSVRMRIDPKSTGGTYVDGDGDIPMRLLDDYDFQDVDLIKLDCEGYELHALRGAKETLKKWKPAVVVEQKPGMAQKFGLKEIGGVNFLQDMGAKLRLTMAGDFFLSWD